MKLEPVLKAIQAVRVDGVTIDRWQLHGTESRRLSLGIKDREAGNAHAPLSLAEGSSARYLLVWSDGLVCRGTLERHQDPRVAFEEARASAYEDEDAAHVLGPAEFPDVKIYDKDISASASDSRMLTSAGLDVASRGTSFGWFVTVDGETGDGFSARQPEDDDEFKARLAYLMQTARQVAKDAAPLPAGTHSVLLHPRVVENYVLSTLMQNLDGSAVAHDESAFDRSGFRSGRASLRKGVGLSIDPLQPYKGGSYRFTGFGLPAAPCTYIEDGRLVQPILNVKYARRLDLKPTPVPFGNDTVRFGTSSRLRYEDALAQSDVLVLSVLGVHTQDRISGDFSLSAPLALAISAGTPAGRLRGTISGNLWETLRSDDLQFVDVPHETTPGMLFPCRFDSK